MHDNDSARLRQRRDAAHRLPPFACGCRDVLDHRQPERLDDAALDAWLSAVSHLLDVGTPPVFPDVVAEALRRRGVAA